MNVRRSTALTALVLLAPLGLAACGSDSSTTAASSTTSTSTSSAAAAPSPSESMEPSADTASMPFGPGCAAVPADGSGSFSGMAQDPVATAASNNPVLSTLVAAVTAADLGDTLNSAQDITVFAPSNDAFAKIDKATLDSVLADKPALTTLLTHHVVEGRLSPADLAGDHKTLAGDMLTVTGSGESFMVGKEKANVICGNVQTANATVYIVDSVLMP